MFRSAISTQLPLLLYRSCLVISGVHNLVHDQFENNTKSMLHKLQRKNFNHKLSCMCNCHWTGLLVFAHSMVVFESC